MTNRREHNPPETGSQPAGSDPSSASDQRSTSDDAPRATVELGATAVDAAALRTLFPHLDPAVAAEVLGLHLADPPSAAEAAADAAADPIPAHSGDALTSGSDDDLPDGEPRPQSREETSDEI